MNSGVVGAGAAGAGLGAGAAGFGPGVGRGPAAGAEGSSATTGLGAAGRAACAGDGAGAPGFGAAGRAACAGEGAGAAGLGAGAALRGAPGFAAVLPAPPDPCKASVNLRTTGASIVEDAERTNSPSSWSLAMTTLLSTPNSLASSYTRTLATSLLLGPVTAGPSLLHGRTHRVLIECSSQSRPTSDSRGVPDRTGTRAVHLVHCGAACSTWRRSAAVSSGPWTLKALGNARRRTARSRQCEAGCTYAPRPGSVPR